MNMGTKGAIDSACAVLGQYPDVNILAITGERVNLGNVYNGVVELMREDFIHYGTSLPKIADYVVPVQAGIRFTGEATEFHRALFHSLIGDSVTNASRYIYAGIQQCATFFTFQAMRTRACDGLVIEARIFKCRPGGTLSFGSTDKDDVKMPFTIEGLDDQANVMGQGGDAGAPLGYLHVPIEGSGVVVGAGDP